MKLDDVTRGPVPPEVLAFWRRKRVSPDFDLEEVWVEEHDLAFQVAGLHATDLLEAMTASIDVALEEGLPWSDFAAGITDTMEELGYDALSGPRLRLIFETSVRVARAAGQWARIVRVAEALPFLVYELGPSEVHRPLHVEWAGTVLPVDDPWWASHFPPNGFGCKCRVRQVGEDEAARLGVAAGPPAGEPDPGWARNPGESRLP